MFDPTIGRWLEDDPKGFEAGDSNLRRYAGNDPINATDPSGLSVLCEDEDTAKQWLSYLTQKKDNRGIQGLGIKSGLRTIQVKGGRWQIDFFDHTPGAGAKARQELVKRYNQIRPIGGANFAFEIDMLRGLLYPELGGPYVIRKGDSYTISQENRPTDLLTGHFREGTPFGLTQPQFRYWDFPGSKTDGERFSGLWRFQDAELNEFKRGCIGLCAIRTGTYRYSRPPHAGDGVRCFRRISDALAYQREVAAKIQKEYAHSSIFPPTPVLFSIETGNDRVGEIGRTIDTEARRPEVDPVSISAADLEPYDFATAFQKTYDGDLIVYWERMPWGQRKNPSLNVHRTMGAVYENVVYGVIVTDSLFRPYCVTEPAIPFQPKR